MTQYEKIKVKIKSVKNPELQNKIYFVSNNRSKIYEPCIVVDGFFLDPVHGRVSNWWTWKNLLTGKEESGYGDFVEIVESEVEENMLPEICSCGYRFEASETICPNCGKKVEEDG